MDLSDEVIEEVEYRMNMTIGQGKITEIKYLEVGADTFIHHIFFSQPEYTSEYILRSFRVHLDSGRPQKEYTVMKSLHQGGIAVPKVYFCSNASETKADYPYLLMEFIPGKVLWELITHQTEINYMHLFLKELVKIHVFDWKKYFPQADVPDISKNSFAFVDTYLDPAKRIIDQHDIAEMRKVIDWLEVNKAMGTSSELVMIHGDYHPGNALVDNDHLYIIDWSNIRVGDFRIDLAFCIGLIEAFSGKDQVDTISQMYSQLSGKKVENINYFLILAHLHNILRFYGVLVDPKITNEDPGKVNMMREKFSHYAKYMIKQIEETTGVSLVLLKANLQ